MQDMREKLKGPLLEPFSNGRLVHQCLSVTNYRRTTSLGHLETNSPPQVKYFHVILFFFYTLFSRPTCQPLRITPEWTQFVLALTL